jgi:hypothetical protein
MQSMFKFVFDIDRKKIISFPGQDLSLFRERPSTFSAGMDSGNAGSVLGFSQ